jgi:hypothetical protein
LILELEKILKKEFKHSCLDTPKTWGSKRITSPNLTPQQILEHITKYGIKDSNNKSAYKLKSVKRGLNKEKIYL